MKTVDIEICGFPVVSIESDLLLKDSDQVQGGKKPDWNIPITQCNWITLVLLSNF